MNIRYWFVFSAVIALWYIAIPDVAFAQGCAMCRTALAVDDPVTQGFNWSIGFLMVMPYLMFAAVGGWILYMRRKHEQAEVAL